MPTPVIDRDDASPLVPEDVAKEILKNAPEQCASLSLFPTRTLARNQQRVPVLAVLPLAYFRNGDTGMMRATEVNWDNVYLNVEEIDCIVPIPKNVADDADYDIWAETRPLVEEAVGQALDAAVFFAVNKPDSWGDAIVPKAVAAGNVHERGAAAAAGGIAEDVNQTMALVEEDGFNVNGHVADLTYKSKLRGARGTDGQKLLDVSTNEIEGAPLHYAMSGLWPTGDEAAELVTGDFRQGAIGIRQDLEWDIWTQATIQDPVTGETVFNLAQQKMVALVVTARFAFAVPNPVSRRKPNAANRFPFAVLTSPAAP